MAETSTFRGALEFFAKLGIFDVILPFLLVFTIVFAILEKTRIFGTEKIGNADVSKKNLNAMTAFVIAFFVIASSRLVAIITEVSANMVVLLMASVLFLLLVGSFHKQENEGFFLKDGPLKTAFMGLMGIGLVAIFLQALKVADGRTWLEMVLGWLAVFWGGSQGVSRDSVASIILMIFVIAILFYIVREPSHGGQAANGQH